MFRRLYALLPLTVVLVATLALVLLPAQPTSAGGTTFTVNRLEDDLNDDGFCTFREAIKSSRENINYNSDCGA